MKNAVTNQIRLLKDIKPSPDWLKSQRSSLLVNIPQPESGKKTWSLPGFLVPTRLPARQEFAFKPVMVSLLLLGLIFGGGFLTVQASKGSLSGDLLYPVKIAIEKVKIKLSVQETKSRLQAEFIEIRAEELSKIIEETKDLSEKREQVVKTVDKLQAQVLSAREYLGNIEIRQVEPEQIVRTIDMVSEKTAQSEKVLTEIKEKLTSEDSKEVVEAIDTAVKETSILAAELKEVKVGIEVQMEVKETELETEEDIIVTSPLKTLINEASKSFEEILEVTNK